MALIIRIVTVVAKNKMSPQAGLVKMYQFAIEFSLAIR
jgi:hypothetical protein